MNNFKEKKSIEYVSRHSELEGWIRDFSAYLKGHPDRNAIIYPPDFATGFAKVYTLEPGLSYRIVDYQLNTDFVFTRQASQRFFSIIYFYRYSNCKRLLFEVNGEKIVDIAGGDYGTLLMTNSLLSQRLEIKKDTSVQGLTIQISEKWLQERIERQITSRYTLFREIKVFQNLITPRAQKLLSDIFTENKSFVPSLYLNNRVLNLLEYFFDRLLKEESGNSFPSSAEEAAGLMKVQAILAENYQSEFPRVDQLSRIALMSTTKLKNAFKRAYGMGLYEFYQKNRMHKAREILESGSRSISEVGYLVGYKNMSNFASAFKKEFGSLPRDFRKLK